MVVHVVTKDEIVALVDATPIATLMEAMRTAYVGLASGKSYVAPITHVTVEPQGESTGGEACIKAGYIRGEDIWVVKVAAGFGANEAAFGISNSQGAMLCFSQLTGALQAVLADDGYLTDCRTAAAAALCVARLAPERSLLVAIFGTGVIARLVVRYVAELLSDMRFVVVSRTAKNAQKIAEELDNVTGATYDDAASYQDADVLISCTPATEPIIHSVKRGALVVALGADGPGKRELSASVLAAADVLLCDSKTQCTKYGEFAYTSKAPIDLGDYLSEDTNPRAGGQTIVVDLTGVAVQDVAVAKIALDAVRKEAAAATATTEEEGVQRPPKTARKE